MERGASDEAAVRNGTVEGLRLPKLLCEGRAVVGRVLLVYSRINLCQKAPLRFLCTPEWHVPCFPPSVRECCEAAGALGAARGSQSLAATWDTAHRP